MPGQKLRYSKMSFTHHEHNIHAHTSKVQFSAIPAAPLEPHVMAEILEREEGKNKDTRIHIESLLRDLQVITSIYVDRNA